MAAMRAARHALRAAATTATLWLLLALTGLSLGAAAAAAACGEQGAATCASGEVPAEDLLGSAIEEEGDGDGALSLRQLRGELRQPVIKVPRTQRGPPADIYLGKVAEEANLTKGVLPGSSKSVEAQVFIEDSLKRPSGAPLFTFYIYRAVSEMTYAPLNINGGNLAGVLWYLHHEVVVQAPRKFDIKKIVRFKVQVKATEPLMRAGMHFGIRMAFDKGQATGPFVCGRGGNVSGTPEPSFCMGDFQDAYLEKIAPFAGPSFTAPFEWQKYGYNVGCNNLGSFPFPTEMDAYYPGAVWYSLPGPCPSKPAGSKDDACKAVDPGGFCPGGTPTGAGDCTWNYAPAVEEITIDELVGIKNYGVEMRKNKEYDPFTDTGTGMSFWNGLHNGTANAARLKVAKDLWAAKYPESPKDDDLPNPSCDFGYRSFYKEFMLKDPKNGPCARLETNSECAKQVQWARSDGIHGHPDWYPGLSPSSRPEEFQQLLYMQGLGGCHRACRDGESPR